MRQHSGHSFYASYTCTCIGGMLMASPGRQCQHHCTHATRRCFPRASALTRSPCELDYQKKLSNVVTISSVYGADSHTCTHVPWNLCLKVPWNWRNLHVHTCTTCRCTYMYMHVHSVHCKCQHADSAYGVLAHVNVHSKTATSLIVAVGQRNGRAATEFQ